MISPEIYKDKPYDTKSDMWSLGCILYEMCLLRPPFMARNFKELRRCVLLGAFPPLPPFYSEELTLLIKALLQLDPNYRPSAAELLKNPFIVKKRKKFNVEGRLDSQRGTSADMKVDLMKTIRMKDLQSLKLELPAPNYKGSLKGLSEQALSSQRRGLSFEPKQQVSHLKNNSAIAVDQAFKREPANERLEIMRERLKKNLQKSRVNIEEPKVVEVESKLLKKDIKKKLDGIPTLKNNTSITIKGIGHLTPAEPVSQQESARQVGSSRERPRDISLNLVKKQTGRLEAPIKPSISIDLTKRRRDRSAFRSFIEKSQENVANQSLQPPNSSRQVSAQVPRILRGIGASSLLTQKKSQEFKIEKPSKKHVDSLDELIAKDSGPRPKRIWATEDNRIDSRRSREAYEQLLDLDLDLAPSRRDHSKPGVLDNPPSTNRKPYSLLS